MSEAIPLQSRHARILDAQASTVLGTDSHLPALAASALAREALNTSLKAWRTVPALSTGDGNRFADRALRDASVLIGLLDRPSGVHVLLTQRASHLRNHAGQIAFPGGAQDASDLSSWHAASREAMEEIGVNPSQLRCIARGHTYTTVTAFVVTPWLAWIEPSAVFTPAASEVDQVFEVPLSQLMSPAQHQRRSVLTPVGERHFYAIPCVDTQGVERFVWGATAAMLRNVYQTLSQTLSQTRITL